MNCKFFGYFRYFLLLMLSFAMHANAASSDVSNEAYVRLPGHIPKQVVLSKSVFLKTVDDSQVVPLTFVLPLRNQDELEELVKRIHDPSDEEFYGKHLTTEQFNERFAPTEEDYNKVVAYAEKLGLSVTGTHSNRTLVNVSAPAQHIEKGLRLNLYKYQLSNGRKFYAPDNDPAVPVSIAHLLSGIVGLDDLSVWKTYNLRKQETAKTLASHGSQTYPSGPRGGFAPGDLVSAYNLGGVTADGTGQIVALFQLASFQESDITTYTNHFGLPAPQLKTILVDGGSKAGVNAEVTLDIELVLALAPKSQIYVYEGPNTAQGVLNTYNRIATDNIAKQVSSSWGLSEEISGSQFVKAENAIFLQMAAHGQTIYAASGDSGAYDEYPNKKTLVVDDPASQPYIVGVGGTTLHVNSNTCAYVSEAVWNNGLGNGAGGGGVSKAWPIPEWQKNVPNIYSKTNRNVPDVSLNADTNTGYAIYYDGEWVIFGGTSCAAPLWAAFTSLVNQELAANKKPALGFANPVFYAIGVNGARGKEFNDITTGNNLFYGAGANYDNATGWGSFNGANLFVTLTNPSVTPPPPVTPPENLKPELGVNLTHSGSFRKNGTGVYRIKVTNNGTKATSGSVEVALNLPKDLIFYSASGSGWSVNKKKLTFTRSGALQPGASYPEITVNVDVGRRASSTVTPSVTVTGGGSASVTVSDPTPTK